MASLVSAATNYTVSVSLAKMFSSIGLYYRRHLILYARLEGPSRMANIQRENFHPLVDRNGFGTERSATHS